MEYEKAEHVVLYMKPKYLLRWKRIVLIPEQPAFLYGSKDDKVFGTRVGQGTKLWIISPGPPDHRPVLVATMKVKSLSRIKHGGTYPQLDVEPEILGRFVEEGYKWLAAGPEKSGAFYGYNDAGDALIHTTFGFKNPWSLSHLGGVWVSAFGRRFQGPRAVAPERSLGGGSSGIRPLQDLARTASRSVFISYKWCDGVKRKARDFAFALARNGFMPWLDTLAFPRAGHSGELKSDPDRLEKLLRYGYDRCEAVVAMGTEHYGQASGNGSNKNWTEREWAGELWENHRPHRILYPHQGHKKSALLKTSKEEMVITSKDPDEAACELREWFVTMNMP